MGTDAAAAASIPLPVHAVPDREPYAEFYRRAFTGMVRLARVLVDDPEDAVEVVQEAFARMYPRYERVEVASTDAYLRATVLNGCRKHLRRKKLALRSTPRPPRDAELAADHVLDAVRRLAPARRDVVMLRYYFDLSEAEIAATLRVKPGTVKSRLHRALRDLQEVLDDND